MITINGNQYRNLPEQVEKNKQDIENITKDKTVTINIKKEKDSYLVQIEDTGKGIKEEEIPFIWNKYYKNEKNHQRNVVGTGLGLSIVKKILEGHQFKYGVESIKNKGTIFYFYVKKA